jgi:hypothetical protein
MGSIDKTRLAQYKALLHLSDEAIELADRYGIDERKLRHVITLAQEYHTEVVRQIIDLNLTAKQVKELCEGDLQKSEDDPVEKIPAPAVKIAKLTQSTASTLPADIARALLKQEGDANLARARLQALRKLLSETELYLSDDIKETP